MPLAALVTKSPKRNAAKYNAEVWLYETVIMYEPCSIRSSVELLM